MGLLEHQRHLGQAGSCVILTIDESKEKATVMSRAITMSSWLISILSILFAATMLSLLVNAQDATPEDGAPAYVVSVVQPVLTTEQAQRVDRGCPGHVAGTDG
jgi:hypothetical protein